MSNIVTHDSKYKQTNETALTIGGWSGGAMVLGKLPVPGRPITWIQ